MSSLVFTEGSRDHSKYLCCCKEVTLPLVMSSTDNILFLYVFLITYWSTLVLQDNIYFLTGQIFIFILVRGHETFKLRVFHLWQTNLTLMSSRLAVPRGAYYTLYIFVMYQKECCRNLTELCQTLISKKCFPRVERELNSTKIHQLFHPTHTLNVLLH